MAQGRMEEPMKRLFALSLLCLAATPAFSETRYLDDRSTAESVIKSLYNAINRKEYGRAWDYFTPPPAANFEAFVAGYQNTASVEVLTGTAQEDGTAGSVFFELPVALKAVDTSGGEKVFAGCYTLRLTNPAAQDPPFKWLHIVKGDLKPSTTEYLPDALPKSCRDGQAPDAKDVLLQQAMQRYETEQSGRCRKVEDVISGKEKPEVHELKWKSKGASGEEPDNVTTLFLFPCDLGAYNSIEVFYIHDSIDGLRQLSFAVPDINYEYADEESAKLKSWRLTGFDTMDRLVNSGYDDKSKDIYMMSKWRGIADAFSNGSWKFQEGKFVLKDYSVDPTFDGEQTPFDVMKDGKIVAAGSP
jgi:hypothetical protein